MLPLIRPNSNRSRIRLGMGQSSSNLNLYGWGDVLNQTQSNLTFMHPYLFLQSTERKNRWQIVQLYRVYNGKDKNNKRK